MSDTPAGNGNQALILLTTLDHVNVTGNVQQFQPTRIMYLVAACQGVGENNPCANLVVEGNTIVGVRAGKLDW